MIASNENRNKKLSPWIRYFFGPVALSLISFILLLIFAEVYKIISTPEGPGWGGMAIFALIFYSPLGPVGALVIGIFVLRGTKNIPSFFRKFVFIIGAIILFVAAISLLLFVQRTLTIWDMNRQHEKYEAERAAGEQIINNSKSINDCQLLAKKNNWDHWATCVKKTFINPSDLSLCMEQANVLWGHENEREDFCNTANQDPEKLKDRLNIEERKINVARDIKDCESVVGGLWRNWEFCITQTFNSPLDLSSCVEQSNIRQANRSFKSGNAYCQSQIAVLTKEPSKCDIFEDKKLYNLCHTYYDRNLNLKWPPRY